MRLLPTPRQLALNVVTVIIAGTIASIIVHQFPALKKWIDEAFIL